MIILIINTIFPLLIPFLLYFTGENFFELFLKCLLLNNFFDGVADPLCRQPFFGDFLI
jgi:hypothetical protein